MKHGNTMNHTDVSRRCGAFFAAMALAFALVAGAALSSCKSNALGDSDRSGEGKGSLAVAIADTASSRLVMPALPTAASVAG